MKEYDMSFACPDSMVKISSREFLDQKIISGFFFNLKNPRYQLLKTKHP
jgi:hypothetical protein